MRTGKDKLIKLLLIKENDCNSLELYLEKMAAKGWMFESTSPIAHFLQFKKCEPKKVKFYVDIFEEYSKDMASGYNLPEYIGMCEEAGWNYISEIPTPQTGFPSEYSFQVFVSEDSSALPIQTNDFFKVEPILKSSLPILFISIILCFYCSYKLLIKNADDIYQLNYFYIIFLYIVLNPILYGIELFIWQFRAKRDLLNQNSLRYTSLKSLTIKTAILKLEILLFISCIVLLFLLVYADFYNFTLVENYLKVMSVIIIISNLIYIAEVIRENVVSIDKIN